MSLEHLSRTEFRFDTQVERKVPGTTHYWHSFIDSELLLYTYTLLVGESCARASALRIEQCTRHRMRCVDSLARTASSINWLNIESYVLHIISIYASCVCQPPFGTIAVAGETATDTEDRKYSENQFYIYGVDW